MMRVKIERIGEGLHPSEVVVAIRTADGSARLVVAARSIVDDSVDVGFPIDKRDGLALVELPRETTTGSWRVWVSEEALVPHRAAEAA
ncbi:hypothetical protein U8607_03825 [Methylobacterium durans]|uniref:hypothetical protein n=1 Tax=Methylobacterium durans TaxID=2202825 RepID=UPI002AFFE0DC|nr:hypothetical protein [Methylobacterium durans]MEA1831204.1 hypothetical protein [Methylobacterium durans]